MKFVHKYIKKPVVVEAVKFEYTDECISFLKEWMGDALIGYSKYRSPNSVGWLEVDTLENGSIETAQAKHIATEGDYIIKGIRGEFYPCKPDIFEETYQLTT